MNTTTTLLLALLSLGLLALLLNWVTRLPAFAIEAIRVEGAINRISLSTIRTHAVPKLMGNFFTLDLTLGQQAFESVPWVRRAVLRRVWPDRLAVQLEEQRAVALWGWGDDSSSIVNHFGEVFEANLGDVEDERLPTLHGPQGSSARVLAMYREVGTLLAALGTQVERLTLSERGSWHVNLDNGAEIELGRGSDGDVLARTERFVVTVTPLIEQYKRPLQYADLRHHDGYALRLREFSTIVSPKGAVANTPKF